jgi:hypothetical protein
MHREQRVLHRQVVQAMGRRMAAAASREGLQKLPASKRSSYPQHAAVDVLHVLLDSRAAEHGAPQLALLLRQLLELRLGVLVLAKEALCIVRLCEATITQALACSA